VSRSDDLRLSDILAAAALVQDLVDRGHDAFISDIAIAPALERLIEIIGESANTLADKTRSGISGVPWSDIRRLRIVLAHHYFRVDAEQVWAIAVSEVPALASAIRTARPDLLGAPPQPPVEQL
jgi:uncharacterized protein with HEPN domain